MGIILIWMQFVMPPAKTPVSVPGKPAPAQGNPGPPAPGETPSQAGAVQAPLPAQDTAQAVAPPKAEATVSEERTLETDLFRVRFGNRGARILSWELKQYQDDAGKPLELVSIASPKLKRFPLDLEFDDPELTKSIQDALFLVEISPAQVEGQTRVAFRYSDGAGLEIRKELLFSSASYVAPMVLQAQREGHPLRPRVIWGAGFGTETGLPPSNGDRNDITQVAFSRGGKVIHKSRDALKNAPVTRETGAILWAGLEDHYFTALILPANGTQSVQLRIDPLIEEGREKQFLTAVLGPQEGDDYKLYAGPKDRELLAKLNLGLEGIVDYGFLPEIAEALFFLLRHIHQVTANWGLSIIILTCVIRLAFFPLTHKSSVSMRRTQEKMKKIQPRIEAIKKKYHSMKKDMANRQKMNEDIMALYAKEGMNPLAGMTGCLPLLLQLPILWGFYNLLVNAIELRHAPFGLWITDLSKKDPYYITPIVMGITMLVQQAMTGSAIPDPTQRKIMMAMPVMFTWFFKDLPSGLVLYWLVNNILGIAQQYLINRQVSREDSAKAPAGT
jgi:YidC/Oxa1 family membrane protein insertase